MAGWEFVIVVLLTVIVMWLWYDERKHREAAELEDAIMRRRAELALLEAQLEEEEERYEKAKQAMDAHPIPADMLDDIGKSADAITSEAGTGGGDSGKGTD